MEDMHGKITSKKTPVLQMVWHIWKAKVAMINQPQVLHMELINKNILYTSTLLRFWNEQVFYLWIR